MPPDVDLSSHHRILATVASCSRGGSAAGVEVLSGDELAPATAGEAPRSTPSAPGSTEPTVSSGAAGGGATGAGVGAGDGRRGAAAVRGQAAVVSTTSAALRVLGAGTTSAAAVSLAPYVSSRYSAINWRPASGSAKDHTPSSAPSMIIPITAFSIACCTAICLGSLWVTPASASRILSRAT